MLDKDEKARRNQLLHSQRDEQRQSIREGLPVPAAMMKALFTYVDKHLSSSGCDDTLRHASEFIRANGLPGEAVIAWLEDKGGYCDCEVFNAEEVLEDAVPGYRDLPPTGWRSRITVEISRFHSELFHLSRRIGTYYRRWSKQAQWPTLCGRAQPSQRLT